jgi:peptidoglycan/xylan/chitin deacetylase (PgdA/CDA1 family)
MTVAADRCGPSSPPIVLLYHRVAAMSRDPQALCVSPERFERQMAHLRRETTPIGLAELIRAMASGDAPDRAVAVTFDDGYEDNLEIALPILEAHDVPATFFITPCADDKPGEFWWDDLERIILSAPRLPRELSVDIGGDPFHWRCDAGAADAPSDPAWNVLSADDPTPRQQLYLALCRLLRPLPVVERDAILSKLRDWSGVRDDVRPTHRRLTTAQIKSLAARPPADIGAHTLWHPVLAALRPTEQRREIAGSQRRLEAIVGRAVTAFSYPFGCRGDYSRETVNIVRRAGFTFACANSGREPHPSATLDHAVDALAIPRAVVRDVDAAVFARQLQRAWASRIPTTSADHAAAPA